MRVRLRLRHVQRRHRPDRPRRLHAGGGDRAAARQRPLPAHAPLTARDDAAGPVVAGQPQLSLSTVYVYDVDTGANTLTQRTSGTAPGGNLNEIALDGYGETLFTGAGSRNAVPAYATADLSGRGSYCTGYHPVAVAPSPDGGYPATGVRSTGDDVYVYEIGGVQPERRVDLGNDVVLAARGLAWRPAEPWLYAITTPPAGGAPGPHVLPSL
ncbi:MULTISPECIES: hypothetical protein [Catenuloplanes]|uniref:WD40 repeat protein n=1 Tax=Catenuloplanes niger TaxID=587534 RepID=A0AAE3ZYE7_9ACTN|nr:hypothetical protein [Catenuloplanes niger]MDR7328293.1 WD40 repeat protein [Catenuloplanes niger]